MASSTKHCTHVSRAQKISTVVDLRVLPIPHQVSRAQKISTVVDKDYFKYGALVSRAQKISTVVDIGVLVYTSRFHALKKFLLL